jgi:Sec-independent protein translocase protein TatA
MFDVGFSEMLLVGLIALLVFGPERLPKVLISVENLPGIRGKQR